MDNVQKPPTQAPSLNAIVSSVKKLTTKVTPLPPRKNPGVGTAQWELLASPGHVLFEQVSILWKLAKKYGVVMAVSICIGLLAFVLPVYAGNAVAKVTTTVAGAATKVTNTVAGWFGHDVDKKAGMPVVSRAPYVAVIIPHHPANISNELFGKLMTVKDFGGPDVLHATISKVQDGKPVDCEQSTKVTDDWVTESNEVPRCRYSADRSRLWVWAVIKNGNQLKPIFGVVRKGADDKAAYYNVAVQGAEPLDGKATINPQFVPRALAADFAELTQGAAQ